MPRPSPLEFKVAALQRSLGKLPAAERLPFVASLERKARKDGDLEMLQVIRAWRKKQQA